MSRSFHGGHFAILVTGCDNLTVDNVTMDTDRDGIDIDCCRNTMVSNCRVNSPEDDAICPKSTYALGETRLTENLTIVNCQVSGFEEGTLLDGTMKPRQEPKRPHQVRYGIQRRLPQLHRGELHLPQLLRSCPGRGGWRHHGRHHHQQPYHGGRGQLRDLHHDRQAQPPPARNNEQPPAETF